MRFGHRAGHASQQAAVSSIAARIGGTADTLRSGVRQHERDSGQREGLTIPATAVDHMTAPQARPERVNSFDEYTLVKSAT